MKSCTFFGHKFTPVQIKPILYNKIIELIRDENVKIFILETRAHLTEWRGNV